MFMYFSNNSCDNLPFLCQTNPVHMENHWDAWCSARNSSSYGCAMVQAVFDQQQWEEKPTHLYDMGTWWAKFGSTHELMWCLGVWEWGIRPPKHEERRQSSPPRPKMKGSPPQDQKLPRVPGVPGGPVTYPTYALQPHPFFEREGRTSPESARCQIYNAKWHVR